MSTRAVQVLLKRAQREAAIPDAEYRSALEMISGVRSSKDPRLTDRGVDLVLAYFEAICWRGRDAGRIPPPAPGAVFSRRGYWASKNPSGNTSRDRHMVGELTASIETLERQLRSQGFGTAYIDAIRRRVLGTLGHSPSAMELFRYRVALERTARSKATEQPNPKDEQLHLTNSL